MESLVASAASSPSFLETPAGGASLPSFVGRQLGAYRIEAAIGAGGMGEVYRAKDTRLGRDVAVKILPAAFAADPQRRSRFEREARAVAALNHPHICTIHDVGHADGIDFLVMELVHGESLSTRLARGPLPLADALARAIEIAEALDRAHQQGIIHRDLKPGNVILARAASDPASMTRVKLLDFGLARIMASPASADPAPSTAKVPATETGAMLGTLQYMAPEQIDGHPADARTDIFAFGAVLYEMVTGRRAFHGASTAALMAAILRDEPPPVQPHEVGRIVRRCLAKDPQERYASIHDVLLDLRGIATDDLASGTVAPHHRWLNRETAAWGIAAVAVTAVATLLLKSPPPIRNAPDILSSSILPPSGLPFDSMAGIAISPDGTKLVFSAGSRLWLRDLGELSAREIPGTSSAEYPFWSPDSRSIGFFVGDRTLMRIGIHEATPTRVCDAPSPRGGSWNADGTIIFASVSGIRRVPAAGGTATDAVPAGSDHLFLKWPYFLPDGRHFLYTGHLRDWTTAPLDVFLGSLDGSAPRRLGRSWSGATYAPPGTMLWVGQPGRTLLSQRLDLASGRLIGETRSIAHDITVSPQRWSATFSASTTGRLVYATGSDIGLTQLVWTERDGRESTAIGPARYVEVALSPDGRRAAATIVDDDRSTADLWELDFARRPERIKLTDTPDDEQVPIYAPGGGEIFYAARRRGSLVSFFKQTSGGAPDEKLVAELPGEGLPCAVSRDFKWLLHLRRRQDDARFDIFLLPLRGGAPVEVNVDRHRKTCGPISPDGQWMLFMSRETGAPEVYVQPFPKGRAERISNGSAAAARPTWNPNGQEIFYFDARGRVLSVSFGGGEEPILGTPQVVFEDGGSPLGFGVAPGPRFLRLMPATSEPTPTLTLVTHWAKADF